MFALYGFPDVRLSGMTAKLRAAAGQPVTRGMEVANWLKPYATDSIGYVCLDDDADYLTGPPVVQTNPGIGLQDADVAACQELLNRVSVPSPKSERGIEANAAPSRFGSEDLCHCGNEYSDHHDSRIAPGFAEECQFFGANEEGGLDEQGSLHCWRYIDHRYPDDPSHTQIIRPTSDQTA